MSKNHFSEPANFSSPACRSSRPTALWLVLALALVLAGCGDGLDSLADADRRPLVVATTGMIGDTARRIAGDRVRLETLMPPGVDPHLYKASEGDVRLLSRADLILYNGLFLEGKMEDVFRKLERTRRIAPVAEAVPPAQLLSPSGLSGHHDPHVWFDVSLWIHASRRIFEQLVALSPENEAEFTESFERLRRELVELDAWVSEEVRRIPEEKRVLVTAHDAFGYFGRRYGIEVVGLQGISTAAQAGLKDIERVVNIIVDRGVKAVFVESSVPQRNIEAVKAACIQRGHQVEIGGQLHSDSLGPAGSGADKYVGMVRHNVRTIVNALK